MKKIQVLSNLDHHNTSMMLSTLMKRNIEILVLKMITTISFLHHVNESSSLTFQNKHLVEFCSIV
jgi:hypothetical protein